MRSGVLPETTSVVTAGSVFDWRTGASSGACSITTWALVPPNPNDDIPARRGRPVAATVLGHHFHPQLVERDMRIGFW